MKVERSKPKKVSLANDNVPFDIKNLIDKIKAANNEELLSILSSFRTWPYKKSDLYHWIDVLDKFDSFLESCTTTPVKSNPWLLAVDLDNLQMKELLFEVIAFTCLLIKHCFSSQLYNSFDHLSTLLTSTDMQIVVAVLELILSLTKHGSYIIVKSDSKLTHLVTQIEYLAENWGGKEYGVSLAECAQPLDVIPDSATNFTFEFFSNTTSDTLPVSSKYEKRLIQVRQLANKFDNLPSMISDIIKKENIPSEFHHRLFIRMRLALCFENLQERQYCVQARLFALSICALTDKHFNVSTELVEEIVAILELEGVYSLKSAALKALRSFTNSERQLKLKTIIDATGANSYHGIIPKMTRACINSLVDPTSDVKFPPNFVASLFSFLFHLGVSESGRTALNQCGIMEQLFKVIQWENCSLDNLNFLSRTVRIIDSLTSRDMTILQHHDGLKVFIDRLEHEVDACRLAQPYEIKVSNNPSNDELENTTESMHIEEMSNTSEISNAMKTGSESCHYVSPHDSNLCSPNERCYPQRATLIKVLLNFLRKTTQYSSLSESIRLLLTEVTLPRSLRHMISNVEYYGSTVFAYSIEVVALYIHNEPSILSTVQSNGLAEIMLHALFGKPNIPMTKDVAASLPNVLTALCLNANGLQNFIKMKPFEKILSIFIKPEYMTILQGVSSLYETSVSLGKAIDQLIRHQPSLRVPCLNSMVQITEEMYKLGEDPHYFCLKERNNKHSTTANYNLNNESKKDESQQEIPLLDYISNLMRFLQTVFASTTQHGEEFIRQKGLQALLRLYTMPNLPIDFANTSSCHYLSTTLWCLLKWTHDKSIYTNAFDRMKKTLFVGQRRIILDYHEKETAYSIILEDFINSYNSDKTFDSWMKTPFWRNLSHFHSYTNLLINLCRAEHSDHIRNLSAEQWNAPPGTNLVCALQEFRLILATEKDLIMAGHYAVGDKELIAECDKVREQFEAIPGWEKSFELPTVPMDVETTNDKPAMKVFIYENNKSTPVIIESEKQSKKEEQNALWKHISNISELITIIHRSIENLVFALQKLCTTNSSINHRRHMTPFQSRIPSRRALHVSRSVCEILSYSMTVKFGHNFPSKLRYKYYYNSIIYLSMVLFDFTNYPYQVLLQAFVETERMDSYFKLFDTLVEDIELLKNKNQNLSTDLKNCIKVWCQLLEKLINSDRMLSTPYPASTLLENQSIPFEPMEFIILVHRNSFFAINKVWNDQFIMDQLKSENEIMSSLLTIVSRSFKCWPLIQSYVLKRDPPSDSKSRSDSSTNSQSLTSVDTTENSRHIYCSVVPSNRPNPTLPSLNLNAVDDSASSSAPVSGLLLQPLLDMGFNRAMATDALMRTGYDVLAATDLLLSNSSNSNTHSNMIQNATGMTEEQAISRAIARSLVDGELINPADITAEYIVEKMKKKKEKPIPIPMHKEKSLERAEFDSMLSSLLNYVFKFLEGNDEVSNMKKCAEVFTAASKISSSNVFAECSQELVRYIIDHSRQLYESATKKSLENEKSENGDQWCKRLSQEPLASELNSRCYLYALICNESNGSCINLVNPTLFQELSLWLVKLIELASNYLKFTNESHKDSITIPKWLCSVILLLDLHEKFTIATKQRNELLLQSSGNRQWKVYQDRAARWSSYEPNNNKIIDEAFKNGEASCRITGDNHRKYTIKFDSMIQSNDATKNARPIMFVGSKVKRTAETSSQTKSKSETKKMVEVEDTSIQFYHKSYIEMNGASSLIVSLLQLIKVSLDPNLLNAILRLTLRITKMDYQAALTFAEHGGVSSLINTKNCSKFEGFLTFSTHIIRHIFEDSNQLSLLIDKEILLQANRCSSGIQSEMYNMLRSLFPVAYREKDLFREAVKKNLKINTSSKSYKDNDDRSPTYLDHVCIKGRTEHVVDIALIGKEVISEILKTIPVFYANEKKVAGDNLAKQKIKDLLPEASSIFTSYQILFLISELIQSFQSIAKIVCQHVYQREYDQVEEDCSVLSFVIDNMLWQAKETAPIPKLFFGVLASVTQNTATIHNLVINEIKSALSRAVLCNNPNKPARIEAIATLINIVIDSCPKTSSDTSTLSSRSSHRSMNQNGVSIIKSMAKSGLVNDLSKAIQSLDLSSPKIDKTVDSLLKTLEIISETLTYVPKNPTTIGSNISSNSRNQQEESQHLDTLEFFDHTRMVAVSISSNNGRNNIEILHADEPTNNDQNVANGAEDSSMDDFGFVCTNPVTGIGPQNILDITMIDDSSLHDHEDIDLEHFSHNNDDDDDHDDQDDDDDNEDDDDEDSDDDDGDNEDDAELDMVHDHDAARREDDENDVDGDDDDDDDDEDDEADNRHSSPLRPRRGFAQRLLDNDIGDDDEDEDEEEEDDYDEEDYDAIPMPPPENLDDFMIYRTSIDAPPFQFNDNAFSRRRNDRRSNGLSNLFRIPYPMQYQDTIERQHPLLSTNVSRGSNIYTVIDDMDPRFNVPLHTISHLSLERPREFNRMSTPQPYRMSIVDNPQFEQVSNIQDRLGLLLNRIRGSSNQNLAQSLVNQFASQINYFIDHFETSSTRMVSSDEGFHSFISNDNPPSLSMLPTNLSRWMEEGRSLMGNFLYDSLFLVQPDIVAHLNENKVKAEPLPKEEETKKTSTNDNQTSSNGEELSQESNIENDNLTQTNAGNELVDASTNLPALVGTDIPELVDQPMLESTSPPNYTSEITTETRNADILTSTVNDSVFNQNDQLMSETINADTDTPPNNQQLPENDSTTDIGSASNENVSSANQELIPMDQSASNNEQLLSTNTNETTASSQTVLSPELRAILGDVEIPEGIDPSYLAALPEDIRQEVIAEQLRIRRLARPPATTQPTSESTEGANPSSSGVTANVGSSGTTNSEISPEFLAALPPDIRLEVLAQQRAEQMSGSNPDTPADPDNFIRTLPASLRRQVLADMDDSQVQLLTGDLAQEARLLRREHALRRETSMMEEYMIETGHQHHSSPNNTNSARQSLFTTTSAMRDIRDRISRIGAAVLPPLVRNNLNISSNGTGSNLRNSNSTNAQLSTLRAIKGKHLLDHESLSSLLILLFVPDNMVPINRLHRLVRNVCYHEATRQWVILSLLEIVERAQLSIDESQNKDFEEMDMIKFGIQNRDVSWLSITFETAFGTKIGLFKVVPPSDKHPIKTRCFNPRIMIHPLASSFVCRKVLDLLTYLAKSFPNDFILPSNQITDSSDLQTQSPQSNQKKHNSHHSGLHFFEVLFHHSSIFGNRHLKGSGKHGSNMSTLTTPDSSLSTKQSITESPFSKLLHLLSQQFFAKSSILTDRLIRLLACSMANTNTKILSNDPSSISNEAPASAKYAPLEMTLTNENLLHLLVAYLTSVSCSTDGLGDATSLIVKLSNIFPHCREIFYRKLLDAAKVLGMAVLADINKLIDELKNILPSINDCPPSTSSSMIEKGVVMDRFNKTSTIVINTGAQPGNKKPSKELHLPSMSVLIAKTSNQFILLRILDIVVELRVISISERIAKENEKMKKDNQEINSFDRTLSLAYQLSLDTVRLSDELQLEELWCQLSKCLELLSVSSDDRAFLVLEPSVEAFFLVHAPETDPNKCKSELASNSLLSESKEDMLDNIDHENDGKNTTTSNIPEDMQKFLSFAEKHRVVLNQILRQSILQLHNGTFGCLIDYPKVLDFDVKRRYFREELKRLDQGVHRRGLSLHVNRANVFEDSFRQLDRLPPEDWKGLFRISFDGEEGQDAGGLLREWYTIIARDIFNPNYALFTHSPGDGVTYMINQSSYYNSNHLNYFKFVGRLIGKAIYENQLLDCYFTRSFYKHILGKSVRYTDMEAEDNAYFNGLKYMLENNLDDVGTEMNFSLEIQEFGITKVIDLKPNGRNIAITEENKHEFVRLVCQEKMTGSIKQQLRSFLDGFYEIVPKRLISIFNEHELELLISGLPDIDIDDLRANTEYHKYAANSLQIQWFWRACKTFDQTDRAKLLQFVTGTSKVPLQGFSALGSGNDALKFKIYRDDRSTDRLPCAHTCFNQLDLPAYETYEKLRTMLLKAIQECSEGFGFA